MILTSAIINYLKYTKTDIYISTYIYNEHMYVYAYKVLIILPSYNNELKFMMVFNLNNTYWKQG